MPLLGWVSCRGSLWAGLLEVSLGLLVGLVFGFCRWKHIINPNPEEKIQVPRDKGPPGSGIVGNLPFERAKSCL